MASENRPLVPLWRLTVDGYDDAYSRAATAAKARYLTARSLRSATSWDWRRCFVAIRSRPADSHEEFMYGRYVAEGECATGDPIRNGW